MRYFLALIFFLFAYNCKAATVWVEDKVFYQAPVMKTKQELQKGLMFVKQLPQDQGMLFDFGEARKISMWMKNTYISLDMLFIDCALKIVVILLSFVIEKLLIGLISKIGSRWANG